MSVAKQIVPSLMLIAISDTCDNNFFGTTQTPPHHGTFRDGIPSGYWPFLNNHWSNQYQI